MACSFEMNGVSLTDSEVYDLQIQAVSELDTERRQMITNEMLDSDTLLHRLQKVGGINVQKFNGQLRIPRGRFAADLIEQRSLRKVNRVNKIIKGDYDISEDVFVLKPTIHGFNIEINETAIANANSHLRKALDEKFTEDQIENKMNELLFTRQELNGYSYDLKKDSRKENLRQDTQAEKIGNIIEYKRSLAALARNQLAVLNSRIRNTKPSDAIYETLLRLRSDLDIRLNGIDPIPGQEGVKGLIDEIKELEETGNKFTGLQLINRDLHRVDQLLITNTAASLTEASLILSVFDSYRRALNTRSSQNPIFTIAEIESIEKSSPNEKSVAKAMYTYMENMAATVEKNRYRTKLKRLEEQMIQNVIQRDQKLKDLYGKDNLQFEKLFTQAMQDAAWWDTTMMDGVVGTITDLGPIPQLQRNFLNNLSNHYASMHTAWVEQLNVLQPEVETELKKLGYGLGVFGVAGVSYRLFRQQDNGQMTTKLVGRASAKFSSLSTRQTDSLWRVMRNPNAEFKEKKIAHNRRNIWRKKNTILADPRKIQEVKDKFPEFAEYFVDDVNHTSDLMKHLNSQKGYDETVNEVMSQVEDFVAERNRFIKDLLAGTGKTSVNDLDVDDKRVYERFEAQNNPFLVAQSYMQAKEHEFGGTKALNMMDRYNHFIPRRFKSTETPIKTSLGEIVYGDTNQETGYYDSAFQTIEENDSLYKFYNLVEKMLDQCSKMVSPQKQNELMNNTFLGVSQTFAEIALDPDTTLLMKISKEFNHILDKWKGLWKTKIESQEEKGIYNPFTGDMHTEVKSRFVTTNKNAINTRFNINGNLFVSSLTVAGKGMIKDKSGRSRIQRTTAIPLNVISTEGITMLSKWLGVKDNLEAVKDKLELKTNYDNVPVGRIIDAAVTAQVTADETFNLPKMLKLYSLGATTYAAMNEAKPILEIIKNHYKQIPKGKLTNTGKNKFFTRRSTTGTDSTIDLVEGSRERANAMADKWHKRNILGEMNPTVYGVFTKTKTSHLTSDEKKIYNDAQKVIDKQLSLAENLRDMQMITEMENLQKSLGERYAASEGVNRLFDLTRFIGLSINMMGGIYNFMAGKVSNMTAASNGYYFGEKALARAERIVLLSHLHPLGGKLLRPASSRKTALLMSRFRVFQDATDEVYKSSMNTAVKLPIFVNPYFIQQRIEFVNQSPVLIAMLLEKEIIGKDGSVSNVWDAMQADGKLKDNFRTDENIKTWELADSQEFNDFKGRVDGAIKNIHGDYTTLGSPMAADSQIFRATMMFKRWQIRYAHTNYAVEHNDSDLGIKFKGRLRSLDAASGAALGVALLTAFTGVGLGVGPLLGLLGGAFIGEAVHNAYGSDKEQGLFEDIGGTLRDVGVHLLQLSVKGVLNPINIATGGRLGTSRAGRYLNSVDRRANSLDNQNLQALMTSTSVLLSSLMMRMIFRYIKNAMDDEDEDSPESRRLQALINMAGNNMQEVALFMNPVAMFESVSSVAAVRMATNLLKLTEQIADYDEKYVNGPYAGRTKLGKLAERTLVPSLFRQDFGFNYVMRGDNRIYGSEEWLKPAEEKMEKEITQVRSEFKTQLQSQMYKELTKEDISLFEERMQLDNPKLSPKEVKRKTEMKIKEILKERASALSSITVPYPLAPTMTGYKEAYLDPIHDEVQELHPDVEIGSDEYISLVKKRFKEIVDESLEQNKNLINSESVWDEVSTTLDLNTRDVIINKWEK